MCCDRVIGSDERSGKLTLSMRSYQQIEDERIANEVGFVIDEEEEDDDGAAILSAAFKRAGIVREMFTDIASVISQQSSVCELCICRKQRRACVLSRKQRQLQQ